MQRLHGMGEGVYREVMQARPMCRCASTRRSGEHRDLLAYLVRRLLENGANSSFVHQLADDGVPIDELLASPLRLEPRASLAAAARPVRRRRAQLARRRPRVHRAARAAARRLVRRHGARGAAKPMPASVDAAMRACAAGFRAWTRRRWRSAPPSSRRAADALEARLPQFCALLVKEARKTWGDCVAEVREAVDFCATTPTRPSASCCRSRCPARPAKRNELRLHGRGVFVCISPWNFPLAIFAGQVVAALVAGNTVAAKPAEQTPAVALEARRAAA